MKTKFFQFFAIACAAFFLQGCATGYNHSLVSSQSNIGFDLNAEPGKLESAISASTHGTTPTFEGGQTLPILASISSKANSSGQFFNGQSSTVVTGDAAYNMSYLYADCNRDVRGVKSIPDVKLTKKPESVPGPGEVKPAIFSSDAMLGLKLAFGRETPIAPSSAKLGFNRQETVSTPVSVQINERPGIIADSASMIAQMDHWVDLEANLEEGSAEETNPRRFHQYFAIGEAANNLSLRSDVRRETIRRITPDMQDNFCEDDYETKVR